MSGLLLCGKRTMNPYYIEEIGINIYSIEELCYYLYNNMYMVDRAFFNEELVRFIVEELELPALGQRLRQKMDYKSDLGSMVKDILTSCEYYSQEECERMEDKMKALGSMSKADRMKARADMLVERKRYAGAAAAYKEILNNRDEHYDGSFVAGIWNNMGVVYTGQFLFVDAVNCFRLACDIERKKEYFDNMICAAIFSKNEELLSNVAAQYQINDDMLDEYIKVIEERKELLVREKELTEFKERLRYDGTVELATFNSGVRGILDEWKDEYRQMNI